MSAIVHKALCVVVGVGALLVLHGEASGEVPKKKARTTSIKQAPSLTEPGKLVIPTTGLRSEVNPKFVEALADPQLNPDFARKYPDRVQRLKAAQTVADSDCFNFVVAAAGNYDAQGCYLDLTVTSTYNYDPPSTNPNALYHGLYIEMCPALQITSYQVNTLGNAAWSSWLAGAGFGSNPGTAPWNGIWWQKSVANFTNLIPSGQPLTIRLRIPSFCTATSCTFKVQELMGNWTGPGDSTHWKCERSFTVPVIPSGYSLGPDEAVCKGEAKTLCLPNVPAGAQVTWYTAPPQGTPLSCPPANCSTAPLPPPWQLAQSGTSNCLNTNILDQAQCYVAVVKQGCLIFNSTVKKIEVCPGPPSATISPTPGSPPLTTVNGEANHACNSWQGKLCLDFASSPCVPTVVNWTKNGQVIPNSAGQTCINTGPLTAHSCPTVADEFKATLANPSNACGNSTPSWKIFVDQDPVGGNITANPPPPLCYDRATKLTHTTSCGKVVRWEKREEATACSGINPSTPWTPLLGSEGTSVWWTGDLQKTTQYQVVVENGACPTKNSAPFTVTVKPPLSVGISANQTMLCSPGSVTLTAQSSWGQPPCNYQVTYQWYKNGLLIGSGPTFSPTTGGNYYVVANGQACGKAKSKVITICDRPKVVISGDCCVCPGKPITLTASTVPTPKNCQTNCTYLWSTGATTPTIQVSQPGTYTVTVTCDGCQLAPVSFKVDLCVSPSSACDLDKGMLQASTTFERRITLAQTFTPTSTGSLTKITHGLQVGGSSVTSYDLLVTTTTGPGLPSWTGGPYNTPNVLFKATGLTIFATGSGNAVVAIPSGQEPCLTAGTKYALILIPGSPATGTMRWQGNSSAASYPNGAAYELNGTTWNATTTAPKDHGFKLDGVCPCL